MNTVFSPSDRQPVPSGTKFRRAIELSRDASEIIKNPLLSPLEKQMLLSELPPYVSRGHGGKFHKRVPFNYRFSQSKYAPHQGKQECARRVRQGVNHG